jgi:hypothetical protein
MYDVASARAAHTVVTHMEVFIVAVSFVQDAKEVALSLLPNSANQAITNAM